MAGGTHFTPTGGWGKLRAILHSSRTKAVEANIRRATQFNALLVEKEIRKGIKNATTAPNAQLTILIKGSSKPLADHGDLFQAVTHQMQDAYTAFVGIMKSAGAAGGPTKDLVNIVRVLHEGTTITVTPAMRGLFFYLWKLTTGQLERDKVSEGRLTEIYDRIAGTGKIIYPLKEETTEIHIPPRPFIRQVFEDKDILAKCRANWEKAVKAGVGG